MRPRRGTPGVIDTAPAVPGAPRRAASPGSILAEGPVRARQFTVPLAAGPRLAPGCSIV